MKKILIVEDDDAISTGLKYYLEGEDFDTVLAVFLAGALLVSLAGVLPEDLAFTFLNTEMESPGTVI